MNPRWGHAAVSVAGSERALNLHARDGVSVKGKSRLRPVNTQHARYGWSAGEEGGRTAAG